MPLRNRVDPFGDLHAVPERGLLTGNRGCLVDDEGRFVRHHAPTRLWIACVTELGGRRSGETVGDPARRPRGRRPAPSRPRRWTPIFFLDDAVALAAGHRPCGECRREAYTAYRVAVTAARGDLPRPWARALDALLAAERLRRGRGIDRAGDRLLWRTPARDLPDGAVVLDDENAPLLLVDDRALRFGFGGWQDPARRPRATVTVLTPPTSVAALSHGYVPLLHRSAAGQAMR